MSATSEEIKRRYKLATEQGNKRGGVFVRPVAWMRRREVLRRSAAGVLLRRPT